MVVIEVLDHLLGQLEIIDVVEQSIRSNDQDVARLHVVVDHFSILGSLVMTGPALVREVEGVLLRIGPEDLVQL